VKYDRYKETGRLLDKGAEDDLSIADLLIKEKRILHGLFFCHL
jgi:hypothetical protein